MPITKAEAQGVTQLFVRDYPARWSWPTSSARTRPSCTGRERPRCRPT